MTHAHRLDCVADISRLHAKERPDAIALDYRDRLTTYAELDGRASQVANGLLGDHQGPGARIGYVGKNLDRFWEVVLGCYKSRTALVSLNWRLAAPELAFVIADADCEILFVGAEFYGLVDQILSQLPRIKRVIGVDGGHDQWPAYEDWRNAQSDIDPMLPSQGDDVILQLYTSGTTGNPKGVRLNNINYLSLFANPPADVEPLDERDVVLIAMPFFHVAGINMGMGTLANGARGVILPEVDPKEILRLISAKGITQSTLVPAVILAVTQLPQAQGTDFSSLKRITYGGSPIPEAVLRQATTLMGCSFMQGYGLTETSGGPVTYLAPADHDPARGKLRSCGRPAPGREIKVVDLEGRTLPAGQIGEILIRATCVMTGYWKREDSNAEAFDVEGYFRSGDAGYLDEEGYLYIQDRIKEMIVSGGENIYPAEVENAIAGHPAVQDVAVIGVPDDRWGEAVKAIIACKAGKSADAAEIIAYARERIAGYKLPKSVDFVAAIPRNASGKILRRDLRQPYWEGRERQVN